MALSAGSRIGPYEIVAPLGAGGMGEVYRARDTQLGRDVAVKVLPAARATDPERLARFEREARLLAALNHPHIAAIYGIERVNDAPAIVLELVEGPTLADRLESGPLAIREALDVARQIAGALEAAHENGIIHRDLKPANIKVRPDGVVKILDFGVAKALAADGLGGLDEAATTHTATTRYGVIIGTAPYMSPEQARGEPVDRRADIWAFGCVLYEMLAGRMAFGGATMAETLAAILEREPDWQRLPAGTPPAVQDLLARCLRKVARERLRDIGDARIEIEQALEQTRRPTESHTDRGAASGARWPSYVTWPRAGFIGAIIVALVGTALFVRGQWRNDPIPVSAQRQLTSGDGLETDPAISPDGKTVAFTSDESGNLDIWVVDIEGGPRQRLTTNPASDRHPSWFPDGSAFVFVSNRDGQTGIWRAPRLDGEAATPLVADADAPSVSPNGNQVAFVRSVGGTYTRVAIAPVREPERVTVLSGDADGKWDHVNPAWSPDGRTICYAATDGLWLVPAAGGTPSHLTTDGESARPAWSADGRFVYFTSYRNGRSALWRIPAAGGRAQLLTSGSGSEHSPSVSHDGRRVAYSTSADTIDLVVRDLVTGGETPFRNGSSRDEMFPVFKPDGVTVYFVSNRWNQYQIWRGAISGEPLSPGLGPVTEQEGNQSYPACSPDGKWLAYQRILKDRRDVFVVATAGGAPVQFSVDAADAMYPAWSADGRQLAFVSTRDGTHQIWRQPIADGRPAGAVVRVTSDISLKRWPVWSPDGARIAYITDKNEVAIVDVAPGQPPTVITRGAVALRVVWSTRSGLLWVPGTWGKREYEVRVMNADGTDAQRAVRKIVLGPDVLTGFFDVSDDERYLIRAHASRTGNIWIIEAEGSRF